MPDGILTPCNVACGCGIATVNSPIGSTCNVTRGSRMTCHSIRPNVRHVGILHLVSISTNHRSRHVILYQSPKFYPNRTTLGRKKVTSCRFLRWRTSAILDCRDPIMGSLKSPCTTSYKSSIETIALNGLVFEKIAFFAFWRQPDKQTNEQMDSTDALSRSRCRERRLSNCILRWISGFLSGRWHRWLYIIFVNNGICIQFTSSTVRPMKHSVANIYII